MLYRFVFFWFFVRILGVFGGYILGWDRGLIGSCEDIIFVFSGVCLDEFIELLFLRTDLCEVIEVSVNVACVLELVFVINESCDIVWILFVVFFCVVIIWFGVFCRFFS